jgi:hypothetical protein
VKLTATYRQARGDESDKFAEYAMVLRRYVDEERCEYKTKVEIRSPHIRQAIKTVLGDYPYLNSRAIPIILRKPYIELFHYYDELHRYGSDTARTSDEKAHLHVLFDFMKKHLTDLRQNFDRFVPNGLITFGFIRTIFKPGDIVVYQHNRIKECYVVYEADEREKDGDYFLQIKCWGWTYSADRFGPWMNRLKIDSFGGTMKIQDLPCYPIKYLSTTERDKLEATLVARGEKWRSLTTVAHREYNGSYRSCHVFVSRPSEALAHTLSGFAKLTRGSDFEGKTQAEVYVSINVSIHILAAKLTNSR